MLSKEETQGPYWFDVDSIRSDIREDRPGATFELALRALDCSGSGPIPNAVIEIWHCDAGGVYSGFESGSAGGPGDAPPGPPPRNGGGGGAPGGSGGNDQEATPTDDGTYLRGAQTTDKDGIVTFTTIFPGWYRGRTTHIHVKVHIDKKTVLTTQLFFDEALLNTVNAAAPYSSHTGRESNTTNAQDSIYDAFMAKVADYAATLQPGDPLDPATAMGATSATTARITPARTRALFDPLMHTPACHALEHSTVCPAKIDQASTT